MGTASFAPRVDTRCAHALSHALTSRGFSAFVCATKDMVALTDSQKAAMLAFLKTRRGDKEF